ncbi:MAG: glutaminase A [Oscillospiraceae bacterium]|nr:glutaminase A [Oscillospiraceae bacterium]
MDKANLDIVIKNAIEYAKAYENTGMVASYIPELKNADKNALGVCIAANNKKIYKAGDCETLFTMQSISKVVSLILALQTVGKEKVFSKVWVEPTGDAFNSLVRLETHTHIPLNPMINAGAIAVAGVIDAEFPFSRFLAFMRRLCGREDICLNERVYLSEKASGMKNRAIAYMLASEGVLERDVEQTLDFYFKMCSVNVTAVDLARIGSILANDGVDIFTGERLIESEYALIAKTLMVTCGMYDGSGEFAIKVGIPAKSGVGGGIMCCVEDNFGIAVYGPSLDAKGNSVWGLKVLEYLSKELKLHYFAGSKIREYI